MKRLFISLFFISGYCFGSNDSLSLRRIKSAPVLGTDLILPKRKKTVKFAPAARVVIVDYEDETGRLKAGNPFRNKLLGRQEKALTQIFELLSSDNIPALNQALIDYSRNRDIAFFLLPKMDNLLGMPTQDGNAEAILALETFAQESIENHFEGTADNKEFLMTQISNKLLNGINGLLDHESIVNYEVDETILNRLFEKLILMARKYNVQLDSGVLAEVIDKVENLYVNDEDDEDDPVAGNYGRSVFEMLHAYRGTKPY